jgi:hypothetical protein
MPIEQPTLQIVATAMPISTGLVGARTGGRSGWADSADMPSPFPTIATVA